MSRKICIVTGTRAEFGLLRWLIDEIQNTKGLELKLIVTGSHLAPEFGFTYDEIVKAGFKIDAKIEMLLSADTASGVIKSMGLGLIGFSDAYSNLAPDLIVLVGDRFEIFAAAAAAMIFRIPIAHIHGGEVTEGVIDEAIRHSITKMAHLHFVAAEPYRQRVVQLGEDPERVFLVGGLGIDSIKKLKLLNRKQLENVLNFKLGPKNLLITFHPETLRDNSSLNSVSQLLTALGELKDTKMIFTMPNADVGGRQISALLENFIATHAGAKLFTSLGQLNYLSCMKHVDGVVGNSSSGIIEAPSLGVATINIGDRQKGRLTATSVINCDPSLKSIRAALAHLYDDSFRSNLAGTINPYGDGGASKKIREILKNHSLQNLINKRFFDIEIASLIKT